MKIKQIRIKTKHLVITSVSTEELRALSESEPDRSRKEKYKKALEECIYHPYETFWFAPMKIALRDEPETAVGYAFFDGCPEMGKVSLSFEIMGDYRRRGYASEAVEAITKKAFTIRNVYSVTAEPDTRNNAAQKVLMKTGFDPVGKGSTGIIYVKKKPAVPWIAVYFVIGMLIGGGIGYILGDRATGTGIGSAAGIIMGLILGIKDKKYRALVEGSDSKRQ